VPKKGKRRPHRLPKVISREEARAILVLPNIKTKIGLRNRTLLQVLYRCGLRVNEACALTVRDVDTAQGYIFIQQGKGSKDRTVPMDPETVSWCKRWAARRPLETDYFFPTLQGTRLNDRYVRELCYRLSREAGVYLQDPKRGKIPVHPHTWRHTCFTEMLEEGFSLTDIQQMAGHSDLKTTTIYLSVRPAALAAKIRERKGVDA
jgi:site-specific recombinase XerD